MRKIKIFVTFGLIISELSPFCAQKINFQNQNFENTDGNTRNPKGMKTRITIFGTK